MFLIIFVASLAIATQTATTAQAQTPQADSSEWRFVTTGDKLYLVTGSQEFVTEVDTSELPVKYFLNPQVDASGNIYLLSVASSDRSKGLANQDRKLSVFFTRTEGQTTRWKELTAADLGLSNDSGIYDFSAFTLANELMILGQNGEVFRSRKNSSGEYQFDTFQTALPPKVGFSKYNFAPTSLGWAPLTTNDKAGDPKNLSRGLSQTKTEMSLGNVILYAYSDPRDPNLPNRDRLTAYASSLANDQVVSMVVQRPIINVTAIGLHDYYAIWSDSNVWMMQRSKTDKSVFGPLTEITSSLGLSGKIVSLAAYQTGSLTNSPSRDAGKNITFYVATDNGKVTRAVINSPTNISIKSMKLLSPTYKIGKAVSAVSSSGALVPTPADPKEAVPGQPGVVQSSNQPAQSQPTASQAPASSSGWTPRLVIVAVSIIGILCVLLIILLLAIHKSRASAPISPGTPGPAGPTSESGSGRGSNPFRPRHQ